MSFIKLSRYASGKPRWVVCVTEGTSAAELSALRLQAVREFFKRPRPRMTRKGSAA